MNPLFRSAAWFVAPEVMRAAGQASSRPAERLVRRLKRAPEGTLRRRVAQHFEPEPAPASMSPLVRGLAAAAAALPLGLWLGRQLRERRGR